MTYERWDTPVSDVKSLAMVSLVDEDGLHVTVQDLRDPARRRYCFTFRNVAAYRNILEEFRLGQKEEIADNAGRTLVSDRSSWLLELRQSEPLLDVHQPGCRHYSIETEDDVLDIISSSIPAIREVAPQDPSEDLPGKSQVLYHPEDREQIDEALGRVRNRNPRDV